MAYPWFVHNNIQFQNILRIFLSYLAFLKPRRFLRTKKTFVFHIFKSMKNHFTLLQALVYISRNSKKSKIPKLSHCAKHFFYIVYSIQTTKQFCFIVLSEKIDTKSYSKIVLVKGSENNFIFLPVFYLIMWLMKAPKSFGKIVILKIWELVSLFNRCQNSLRQNSPKMMHFQAWKNLVFD